MKSVLLTAACGACLLMSSSITRAALVEVDLFFSGDAMITRDTDTGLDWLDLTATVGHSINDVLDGYGGYINSGFRYATIAEVAKVFENAGITADGNVQANEYAAVGSLIDLRDATGGHSNDVLSAEGFAGLGEPSQGPAYMPGTFQHNIGIGGGAAVIPGPTVTYYTTAGQIDSAGNFLVRPSEVPIPPALWIFGSGLLGLIGTARRKIH